MPAEPAEHAMSMAMQAPGCSTAMHMECAGLEKVPKGKWFCPHHASLQGKSSKPRPVSAKSSGSLDADYGAKAKSKAGSKAGKAQPADAPGRSKSSDSDDADYGARPKSKSGSKAGKAAALTSKESSESADGDNTAKPKSKSGSKAGKAQPAAALIGQESSESVDADNTAKPKSKSGSKAGKARSEDAPASKVDDNGKADRVQEDPATSAAPGKAKAVNGSKAGKARPAEQLPAILSRTHSKAKQGSGKAGTARPEEERPGHDKPAKKRKNSSSDLAAAEDVSDAAKKPKSSKTVDATKKQQSGNVQNLHAGRHS